MPVMDGIQATKEIRRLEKLNATAGYPPTPPQSDDHGTPIRTPSDSPSSDTRSLSSPYRSSVIIVALTASSLQSDRVAALAAGCNDFLTKPVSLLWLNNKIIEWGSIKALQMWADLRPEVVRSISTGQDAQARNVAQRLHVPQGRSTPSPSRSSTVQTVMPLPPPTDEFPSVSAEAPKPHFPPSKHIDCGSSCSNNPACNTETSPIGSSGMPAISYLTQPSPSLNFIYISASRKLQRRHSCCI
jgi:osomolarity two-component system, response regulator SSK1